jgi:hypothetical protein
MNLHPFAKKQSKIIALIDIGSGAVGGALVLQTTDKVQAIYHTETKTESATEPDYRRFTHSIDVALRKTIGKLLGHGPVPDEFHCFLASPFMVAQTVVSVFRDEAPGPFTLKSLNGIARKNADSFVSGHSESGDHFYLLENKVLSIKLDGYEIADPFGETAREIEVAQYLCGSPRSVIRPLLRAIQATAHSDRIFFHSFALAAYGALREISGRDSFMAIDVSGELTDVLVVVNGVLLENISFPFGLNKILRQLSDALGTWPEATAPELTLFLAGKLHDESAARIKAALSSIKDIWLSSVAKALSLALDHTMLPKTLFLTGETKLNSLFLSWLNAGDFRRFTLGHGQFEPLHLNHSVLADLIGQTGDIKDTYLLLESYYYENVLRPIINGRNS